MSIHSHVATTCHFRSAFWGAFSRYFTALGTTSDKYSHKHFGASRLLPELWRSHERGLVCAPAADNTRHIYVKKVGRNSCSEAVMLGLTAHLRRVFPRVGFFKPVGTNYYPLQDQQHPRNVVLMHQHFKMRSDPSTMCAISEDAAFKMLAEKRQDEFLELCQNKLADYEASNNGVPRHDITVIDGWQGGGFGVNAALAKQLESRILLCVDYIAEETPSSCFDRMAEVQEHKNVKCDVLGLTVTGVPPECFDELHSILKQKVGKEGVNYLGTLPKIKELDAMTLEQVYTKLKGRLLFTELNQVQLGDPVDDYYVVTSHSGTMLGRLMSNSLFHRSLLVTTPDRIDTITTAMAVHSSGVCPLAGVVITDHSGVPSPFRSALRAIFTGLERSDRNRAGQSQQYQLPIFMTSLDTFQAVQAISSIEPAVLPSSHHKIEASILAFDENVDKGLILKGVQSADATSKLTPARFIHSMRLKCARQPQTIVLPESNDHRILSAAAAAHSKGLAKIVLLGEESLIQQEAAKIGVSLAGVSVVDIQDEEKVERYAAALVEARKKKGLTRQAALDLLKDVNYFATMMVKCGDADGMVSGAAHTTAATIRPGLQVLKDPKMPLISSVFFMCLPDKVLVYGDCAVNVDPNPQDLAYIAIASAETAAAFGIEPRVAMLSYSTLGSGSGPGVEKVTKAVSLAQEARPDIMLTGPIQYDAATNERIAAVKVKDDTQGVAGQASVLIFPDLNTGNNTYKAVQQATDALAIGPVMQGLNGAVNDLSRGCTVHDIVDTICVTSLQAMFKKSQ